MGVTPEVEAAPDQSDDSEASANAAVLFLFLVPVLVPSAVLFVPHLFLFLFHLPCRVLYPSFRVYTPFLAVNTHFHAHTTLPRLHDLGTPNVDVDAPLQPSQRLYASPFHVHHTHTEEEGVAVGAVRGVDIHPGNHAHEEVEAETDVA